MKLNNQRGSSHIVLILGVVVVVAVAAVGYRVVSSTDTGTANTSISAKTSEPASIKSSADIKKASAALDDTAIDGSVNPAQLDRDLNSLL